MGSVKKVKSEYHHEYYRGYRTSDEIEFVDGLITNRWTLPDYECKKDTVQMLKSYIRTAKHRKFQDKDSEVDWEECIKYAEKLLTGE